MTLLVFLGTDDNAGAHWLRLDADGAVVGRGAGFGQPAGEPVVAVAPGEAVVLHWVELPALAPAQAAAAARMLAADVSAASPASLHVALGAPEADGQRAMAIVQAEQMRGWMTALAAAGLEPERMIPEPLLLPLPPEGAAVLEGGGRWLVRGARLGFAAEADLARLMLGETLPVLMEAPRFHLGATLDLLQGDFAKKRRWRPEAGRLKRLAVLAAAIVITLIGTELAGAFRHGLAADAAERELAAAAQGVLPRGTLVTSPEAQVRARLAALGGSSGFGGLAAPLLAALQARPQLALVSLDHAAGRGLVAGLEGPDAAGLAAALQAAGLNASLGAVREAGGRQQVDMTVQAR